LAAVAGSGDVLSWALATGHEVAALARDPASLPGRAGLTVITGDATDAGAVAEVLTGADAAVSALGPRGARTPALLATAASAIVTGMDKAGVRRLICVSAAGAFIEGDPEVGPLTDCSWVRARPVLAC
jgi:putative NADH-flavin reductase